MDPEMFKNSPKCPNSFQKKKLPKQNQIRPYKGLSEKKRTKLVCVVGKFITHKANELWNRLKSRSHCLIKTDGKRKKFEFVFFLLMCVSMILFIS